MYNNNDDITKERIDKQEEKYRYITIRFLKDLFSGYTITAISGTPTQEGVDVRFSAITNNGIVTYDVEVKERNKTEQQIKQYPTSELKLSKYNSMCSAHTNNRLIYIQYVNEVAYIYDMDKLDWDKVRTYNWKIKKTQYDDDSEYIIVPTYFIPYNQTLKKINVEKYYSDYYANNK